MSNRPDIIIADFLKYNEYALEELKETSPAIDKAVSDVIGAIFQKYAVDPTKTGTGVAQPEGIIYYKIIWSEKSSEENIVCQSLEQVMSKIAEFGMTPNPNNTYVKTKIGVYNDAMVDSELTEFRVDVGKSRGDYNYEVLELQTYLAREYKSTFKDILEYSGFDFDMNDKFLTQLSLPSTRRSQQKLLLKAEDGTEIGIEIKNLDTTRSFGTNAVSKYRGDYTYKVVFINSKNAKGNILIDNSKGFLTFKKQDLIRLLDGTIIDAPPNQIGYFFENLAWSPQKWKSSKMTFISGQNNTEPAKPSKKANAKSYVYIFPDTSISPEPNTGNRKGPTQSASDYLSRLIVKQKWSDKDRDEKYIGLKGKDAEFIVRGNDGENYTLSRTTTGQARWIKAKINENQVMQNIAKNETSPYQEEDLEAMNISQLNALLKEKKEALTVFEPSEPEYVNLEIEIDDIEEELDTRNLN